MALLEMKKIRILTHGEDAPELLEILQRAGSIEFIDISNSFKEEDLKKKEKTAFEFNYVSGRLDFAVRFLSKFQKKNPIKKILEDQREYVTQKEMENIAKSFYFNDLVEEVANLETQISEAGQRIQKLEEEERLLKEWVRLDIPLDTHLETKYSDSLFVKIKEDEKAFTGDLKEKGAVSNLLSIADRNFVLTYLKNDKEIVLKTINEFGVETIELPKRRGTPEEELERIGRAKKHAEEDIVNANKKAKEISDEHLSKLKILSDYFYWKKQKNDLLMSSIGTEKVSVFEAWCPTNKFAGLNKKLEENLKLFAIEELEPNEGEIAPVEIENKGIFKAFETITRLYGLPEKGNLDPTMFLAAFFFIFFGLCLTDVGYGIIVLVLVGSILLFFKVPKETKPLFQLIMLGGLASVIVGFFFGGYFGAPMGYMPEFLQKIQLFDPVAKPIPVFYLALALGVLQVVVGMILKIVTEAKNKDLLGGILDQGPWLILFFSIFLYVAGSFGLIANSSSYVWIVVSSLILIVVTQGRKEKGIIKKSFKGTLSLYNFVSYFSDVLSYSRLLALGLATSALAFAVNLIATLARDMIPYVGLILMVIILIIGHLFNLVVNILGAFIHSARLQFVEFFGKFLSGTGRNFRPFKQEERNVVIVEAVNK